MINLETLRRDYWIQEYMRVFAGAPYADAAMAYDYHRKGLL